MPWYFLSPGSSLISLKMLKSANLKLYIAIWKKTTSSDGSGTFLPEIYTSLAPGNIFFGVLNTTEKRGFYGSTGPGTIASSQPLSWGIVSIL